MSEERIAPYAAAIRKLLLGVVYHDDPSWSQIRDYEFPIREYLGKIGLGLHLDEIGSFAYLYEDSRDEDNKGSLPSLTTRQQLSFSDTLLLVLLRERLDEHEMRGMMDDTVLLLREEDILEMMTVFLSDSSDARRVEQKISSSINRLQRYGFLTERGDKLYEVRPLIRAKISADELEVIKASLTAHIQPEDSDEVDDDEFV
jgi:hypothetical protein